MHATLHDRDLVTAGDPVFAVSNARGVPANEELGRRNATAVVDKPRLALQPSQPRPSFRVETCDSGLTLVTGAMFGEPEEPASVSDVAGPLFRRFRQFTLVDFKKAELPVPAELHDRVPLFDWLPPEIAVDNSPLIIPPTTLLDMPSLLNNVWDNDAVVVLYSEQDPVSVISHLRMATRLNLDGSLPEKDRVHGMLGYCWPSVLAPLLAFRPVGFINALLSGIDAVLIEIPDLPGTWQIYSRSSLPEFLVAMGFRQRRNEELARANEDS